MMKDKYQNDQYRDYKVKKKATPVPWGLPVVMVTKGCQIDNEVMIITTGVAFCNGLTHSHDLIKVLTVTHTL